MTKIKISPSREDKFLNTTNNPFTYSGGINNTNAISPLYAERLVRISYVLGKYKVT